MRIKLRLRSPYETLDCKKYLVYINTEKQTSVGSVEDHIRAVLELEGESIQLLDEDCIIPPNESSRIFVEERVYTYSLLLVRCRVTNSNPLKRPRQKKIQPSAERAKKVSTLSTKSRGAQQKKKPVTSSSSGSSSSSSSSVDLDRLPSSSSESDDERKVNLKKRKKSQPKEPLRRVQTEATKARQINAQAKSFKQPGKTYPKKIIDEKSDDDTPQVTSKPKQAVEQTKKVQPAAKPKELTSIVSTAKPQQKPIRQPPKKVLELPSDEDSSNEADKPQDLPIHSIPKASIPIAVRKQQFKAQHAAKPEPLPQKKPFAEFEKAKLLEPTVREQNTVMQRQAHTDSHNWQEIAVKILEKSRKEHNKSFLRVDQKIMFQTTELDQEKFIPKTSDWKKAEVQSVAEASEDLVLVTQPRREKLKLCEYNIVGLKITEEDLNDFQRRMVREIRMFGDEQPKRSEAQDKDASSPEQKEAPVASEGQKIPKQGQLKQQAKQQTPFKDLVLSQVDYYFSDRSYNRDSYLISHAALHPELCKERPNVDVSLDVIMNFPKLKRMNLTKQQLMGYLREETQPNASYELHPTESLIRKKGLRIDPPKESLIVTSA